MDVKKILNIVSTKDYPIALGGCKSDEKTFECCEYNITIFDGINESPKVIEYENTHLMIHHGTLNETQVESLIQFDNLKILSDEKWELKIFLSQIKEKKEKFFKTFAKNCIIDAGICLTKSKEGIKKSDLFASSWLKSAAFFLADAILLANMKRPSPTHMLEQIRNFEKNKINEKFSAVNESLGIERATPSLLSRMNKSTIGFSDMVEKNNHSKIIQKKYDYLTKNSLLTDCYFYLGYINRNNFFRIKDSLSRKPELIHILKVAFDLDNDFSKIEQQTDILNSTAKDLLSLID